MRSLYTRFPYIELVFKAGSGVFVYFVNANGLDHNMVTYNSKMYSEICINRHPSEPT